jgi:hypothetical protein
MLIMVLAVALAVPPAWGLLTGPEVDAAALRAAPVPAMPRLPPALVPSPTPASSSR